MNMRWFTRLACFAIVILSIMLIDLGPPAVASPANDGGFAGIDQHTIMIDQNVSAKATEVAVEDMLAFPDAVGAGLVRPATDAEVDALKAAWKDNERIYTEVIKPYYEKRAELIAEMQAVIPIGTHWQDPQTGIVFETVVPDGKMVTFEHYGVKRTALEGESSSGKLSKKRAVELGYKV